MQGLAELRVKESDRLAATETALRACGVDAVAGKDSLTVHGTGAVRGGATVITHMDHRIAMAFAVLGCCLARAPVTIHGAEGIGTSDPGFLDTLAALGGHVSQAREVSVA